MTLPIRFLRFIHRAVFVTLAASAAAWPGDPDLDFNPPGTENMPGIVTLWPASNSINSISKIALQPDGKIIGMGHSLGPALVRWFPDGRLDPSFGIDGIARPELEHLGEMHGLMIQPDGRILMAGSHSFASSACIVRFLPDGDLDPAFGEGGRVVLSLPNTSSEAVSLAVLSNGKILAGGALLDRSIDGAYRPRFWRMLPDGSLDQAFGNEGGVTLPGPGYISHILVQPDGKILATGAGHGGAGAWVGRLEAWGAVDAAFGNGGRLDLNPSLQMRRQSTRLALQENGNIITAGDFRLGMDFQLVLNRFLPGGIPDLSFNTGGRVLTNLTTGDDLAGSVSVQDDGKVLVAGTSITDRDFAMGDAVLVRYQTNGVLDGGFGTGGIAKFGLPEGLAEVHDLLIQPDGKILLGGRAVDSELRFSMLLARCVSVTLPQSLSVEWPAGTRFDYGGTVQLGPVLRGDATTTPETTLTLRNTGPAPLTNPAAAISGPGAAHFSLLSTLPPVLESGASAALSVRFLPATEVSDFTAALVIDAGTQGIEDFLIVLRGETQAPGATLALLEGSLTVNANTTVDFGPVLATQSRTRTFTIKNTGNIDLTIQGISLGTAGTPGDFTAGEPESNVVSPGGTTTFSVTFTPAGAGARTARLRIASTDSLNPPHEINLTGSLAAGMDAWRLTHFGTLLNEGDAADFSDPDGDGVVNLMEYATLTEPDAPDPPAPGEVALSGNLMEYTFMRPAGATDQLIYSMEWSLSPEGPWGGVAPLTVLSDDGTRQRVRFSLSVVNSPRRFVRLRVERK
jgi:uncharacterized delta-60 repeat protein